MAGRLRLPTRPRDEARMTLIEHLEELRWRIIKLGLYAAFLLTLPVLIYQVWAFVAPAVGEVGRAFAYVLIALSSSLFLAGVAFGYYAVLPVGLGFLLNYATDRYEQIITADTYLAFVTRFLLAFG